MTVIRGDKITGIDNVINADDVANVSYVKSIPVIPRITSSNIGQYLSVTGNFGTRWISRTTVLGDPIEGILYVSSQNKYVLSTQSVYSVSTNGITWSSGLGGNPLTAGSIRDISFGNNLYLSGATNGQLLASTNATVWFLRTSGAGTATIWKTVTVETPIPGSQIRHFYVTNTQVGTSTDSIVWNILSSTSHRIPASNTSEYLSDIICTDSLILLSGLYGELSVSTNGTVWTLRTSGVGFAQQSYNKFLYSEDSYYLAGNTGYNFLRTSTDTITWSLRTTGTNNINRINFIGYDIEKSYYLMGSRSFVYLSTNGVIWSPYSQQQDFVPTSICPDPINNTVILGGYDFSTNRSWIKASDSTMVGWKPSISGTVSSTVGSEYNNLSFRGSVLFTTNTLSGSVTQTDTYTFILPQQFTNIFIETVDGGTGGTTTLGGNHGNYNSYLFTRADFTNATSLSVTVGRGGPGSSTSVLSSFAGSSSVTWSGDNNTVFGTIRGTTRYASNPFYSIYPGTGSGGAPSGQDSTIYIYGNLVTTPAGSDATQIYSDVIYGPSGGGGTTVNGNIGGNGFRGGGGGCGTVRGGNGGGGCVRITWW